MRAGKARLDLHANRQRRLQNMDGRLGGCQIHECVAEDPESAGFRSDRSMVEVNRMVADIRPDALVAASTSST